jgi:hypothetical protein
MYCKVKCIEPGVNRGDWWTDSSSGSRNAGQSYFDQITSVLFAMIGDVAVSFLEIHLFFWRNTMW